MGSVGPTGPQKTDPSRTVRVRHRPPICGATKGRNPRHEPGTKQGKQETFVMQYLTRIAKQVASNLIQRNARRKGQGIEKLASQHSHRSHQSLESLEHRQMFAVVASFSAGTLSVFGDSLDNNITVSRNAAGTILVNGGAVSITGGT